jgi:hypothetical protein
MRISLSKAWLAGWPAPRSSSHLFLRVLQALWEKGVLTPSISVSVLFLVSHLFRIFIFCLELPRSMSRGIWTINILLEGEIKELQVDKSFLKAQVEGAKTSGLWRNTSTLIFALKSISGFVVLVIIIAPATLVQAHREASPRAQEEAEAEA